jgi:hypothetical protein
LINMVCTGSAPKVDMPNPASFTGADVKISDPDEPGRYWSLFLVTGGRPFGQAPGKVSHFRVPCAPPGDGGDDPKLYRFFTFSLPKSVSIPLPSFTVGHR